MATSLEPTESDDTLRAEYDFRPLRGVVRGKYAARYRERSRVDHLPKPAPACPPDQINAVRRPAAETEDQL